MSEWHKNWCSDTTSSLFLQRKGSSALWTSFGIKRATRPNNLAIQTTISSTDSCYGMHWLVHCQLRFWWQCTVHLQSHKMQHSVACTCEMMFQKNHLLPPLSHGTCFNLNKDAARSFRTLVLKQRTASQYTP